MGEIYRTDINIIKYRSELGIRFGQEFGHELFGKIIEVGAEVPISLSQVMSKEVHLVGASGYTHEDILKVVDHINNKVTPISTIVTQVYPLDELQAAMDKAIEAKETIKVVVDLTK